MTDPGDKPDPARRRRLVVTDLDGTFIGDDDAMRELWDRLDGHGIAVAFSTGRHLASIQKFYDEKGLQRRASACLCMVGTDVFLWRDGGYRLQEEWHRIIGADWNQAAVERIVDAIPDARRQPAEWRSPFKSSYFLESEPDRHLGEIRDRLNAEGLQAKVIYSAHRFLDLLPIHSGKGEAVRFLARTTNVEAGDIITCGDTGNDLDMMRAELGVRCIAVGNAAPELKRFQAPQVYHAQAPFARGIIEGLQNYGWL